MKKIFRTLFKIIFIFLSVIASVSSEEEKIKIGLLVPLTGENSEIGKQIINATRMALKTVLLHLETSLSR